MWAHHSFWCIPFGILFLILIISGVFFRIRMARRFGVGGCRRDWYDDAETIIRRRFANGEIDEAEYQKLREALKK